LTKRGKDVRVQKFSGTEMLEDSNKEQEIVTYIKLYRGIYKVSILVQLVDSGE